MRTIKMIAHKRIRNGYIVDDRVEIDYVQPLLFITETVTDEDYYVDGKLPGDMGEVVELLEQEGG